MREVKKIFTVRKVPEILNRTYIVRIPKIQGPKMLGNYRPISLCNTIYKVMAKIIVARLRPWKISFHPYKRLSFREERDLIMLSLPKGLFIA